MPDITLKEKSYRNKLISCSWEYLCENFHKFKEDNRIKIALEVCKKNMPTVIEGEMNTNVLMGVVKIDDKPLETKLGT